MIRLTSFVFAILFSIFGISSLALANLIWTGDWTKTEGFFGPNPPFPPAVTQAKDAFGAASTKDDQITNINLMPGVGKTQLGVKRDPNGLSTFKVGAIFERSFMLTDATMLKATATVDGFFSAVGLGWLGPSIDFANARSIVSVVNTDILAVAFVSTPDLSKPAFGAGIYPGFASNSDEGDLAAGNYTFRFLFDSDVQLGQGPALESLGSFFFGSHTADLTVVPEPTTFMLIGIGMLFLLYIGRIRKSVA